MSNIFIHIKFKPLFQRRNVTIGRKFDDISANVDSIIFHDPELDADNKQLNALLSTESVLPAALTFSTPPSTLREVY